MSHLPSDAAARKAVPLYSGLLRYFPDALVEIARLSQIGNDQHNPGAPLHWDRSKSQDEHDALLRHLLEAGTVDTDGVRHSTKAAWRALAALQKELEAAKAERCTVYSCDHSAWCSRPAGHKDLCRFDRKPEITQQCPSRMKDYASDGLLRCCKPAGHGGDHRSQGDYALAWPQESELDAVAESFR